MKELEKLADETDKLTKDLMGSFTEKSELIDVLLEKSRGKPVEEQVKILHDLEELTRGQLNCVKSRSNMDSLTLLKLLEKEKTFDKDNSSPPNIPQIVLDAFSIADYAKIIGETEQIKYLNKYLVKLTGKAKAIRYAELSYNEKGELISADICNRSNLASKYSNVYQNGSKKTINFWFNHPQQRTESITYLNGVTKYDPQKPAGIFYILYRKDHMDQGINIYKIGRTQQTAEERLKTYPKGSKYLFYLDVKDIKVYEDLIKCLFINKYKSVPDCGAEYFQGDIDDILKDVVDFKKNQVNLGT